MRALALVLSLSAATAFGNAAGVVGYSGAPPNSANCNGCHSGGAAPTVSFSGPTTLGAGATGTYTFTVNGGSGAGVNISVSDPSASLNPVSATLGVAFGELYQKARLAGGNASVQFSLTAPPFAGTLKLYGTGNAVNADGNTGGDSSRSGTFDVTITGGSGANPPVITTAPLASPNPVNDRTASVSVVANDDGTEANLSYTWSATGPAPVAFSPNGSNAAKSSTASFSTDGDYVFTVAVRDGTNRTVTGTVNVKVNPAYTYLRMVPVVASVAPGATLQFTTTQRDQFDRLLASPQPVTYLVPFGGSISATGLFRAQTQPGGPFVVQSSAGGKSTASTVQVGGAAPTAADTTPPSVTLVLPATAGTVLTTATVLEAVAADDTGVAEVAFEVAQVRVGAVANGPPWRVNFAQVAGLPGGTNNLEAVARDIAGNTTRSSALSVTTTASTGGDAGGGGGAGGGNGTDGGTGGGQGAAGGCGCSGPGGVSSVLALLALLALVALRRRKPGRA